MSDPMLFDLMHGVNGAQTSRSGPSPSLTKKDRFELALDKVIKEHVDFLMANEAVDEHKLLPPAVRRAKLEQEIREATNFNEFGQQVGLAVKILHSEGHQFLEKEEYIILQDNMRAISQHLDTLNLEELNDETLQAALNVPEKCGQYILKIGINKYIQGLIDESLAIFLFLTMVNPDEPDYWFRFGLVARKCEKYSLALSALATTSDLAPDFAGAHVYAAYCHLKMHSKEGVVAELGEAKKIVASTQVEEKWKEHIVDVENLLAIADSI